MTASSSAAPRRTVAGTVIPPAGARGRFAGALVTFEPGSLSWGPRTVLLDREHQHPDTIGRPLSLAWTDDGALAGEWLVFDGPERDRAVDDIESGIRTGLSLDAIELVATQDDDGVWTVTGGRLVRVSLTTVPAFEEATATVNREAAA